MKTKFPKTIAVTQENPGTDDSFYSVHEQAAYAAELNVTKPVAIYVLQEVGEVRADASYRKIKGR